MNLKAVAVNATAIRITWQPPISPNGNVTYRVMVSNGRKIETAATSVVVTNLSIYTGYNITVTAKNTAGMSDNEDYFVKTGESGM